MIKRIKKGYLIIILVLCFFSGGCFISYAAFKGSNLPEVEDINYYVCEQEILESSDPNVFKIIKGRIVYFENNIVTGLKSFSKKAYSNERSYLAEKRLDVGTNFEVIVDDDNRTIEIRESVINEISDDVWLNDFISQIESSGYSCYSM